nr:MAG TPA: hypothetical protein [Caudoviricetes sp.]
MEDEVWLEWIAEVMALILNYKNKIIDTEQQNIVNSFIGGAR